jgi:hypothetical protein
LTGKQAPGWVNRAAKLGTMFPCVIPTEWVEPPDANNNGNGKIQLFKVYKIRYLLKQLGSDTSGSPSSSSCSSNTPLNQKKPPPMKIEIVAKKKRRSTTTSPTSRRPSGSTDSIQLVRTPVMEDDEIDCSSPVKEPDTHRPEVIRSATQLSITAPVELAQQH